MKCVNAHYTKKTVASLVKEAVKAGVLILGEPVSDESWILVTKSGHKYDGLSNNKAGLVLSALSLGYVTGATVAMKKCREEMDEERKKPAKSSLN